MSDPHRKYKGVCISDEVYIRDIEPYKGHLTQKGLVLSKKRLNFTIVLECGETVTRTEKNIFVVKRGKLKDNPMYWEILGSRKWVEGFGNLPWGIAMQRPLSKEAKKFLKMDKIIKLDWCHCVIPEETTCS